MEEPLIEVNRISWVHGFIFGLVPGNNATIDPGLLAGNRENFVVKTNRKFLNDFMDVVSIIKVFSFSAFAGSEF